MVNFMALHKKNNQPADSLLEATRDRVHEYGLRRIMGMAVLVGVGLSLSHTIAANVDRKVAQSAAWRLPTGTSNYIPIINPDRPQSQADVETVKGTSLDTDITWPEYVGYGTNISSPNQPGAIRLEVGAKVTPEADGSVEINPLYGLKSIHLTKNQLMAGPTVLPLGGDFTLQVSENQIGGDPHIFFGSKGQQPDQG
jgi:hypothetical protein